MNCFFSRWNESDEIDRGIEWKEASFIESLMEMMEKNFCTRIIIVFEIFEIFDEMQKNRIRFKIFRIFDRNDGKNFFKVKVFLHRSNGKNFSMEAIIMSKIFDKFDTIRRIRFEFEIFRIFDRKKSSVLSLYFCITKQSLKFLISIF